MKNYKSTYLVQYRVHNPLCALYVLVCLVFTLLNAYFNHLNHFHSLLQCYFVIHQLARRPELDSVSFGSFYWREYMRFDMCTLKV